MGKNRVRITFCLATASARSAWPSGVKTNLLGAANGNGAIGKKNVGIGEFTTCNKEILDVFSEK